MKTFLLLLMVLLFAGLTPQASAQVPAPAQFHGPLMPIDPWCEDPANPCPPMSECVSQCGCTWCWCYTCCEFNIGCFSALPPADLDPKQTEWLAMQIFIQQQGKLLDRLGLPLRTTKERKTCGAIAGK